MKNVQDGGAALEKSAKKLVEAARRQLVLDLPALLPAIYLLPAKACERAGPLWTDGTTLYYHPETVARTYLENRRSIAEQLLHVLAHGLLGHFGKRGGQPTLIFDAAADLKAPKYLFPTPLAQLVKALDWVYDNAEKYNLDLDRFLATGDSSGGYYVAELAALQGSEYMQQKLGLKAKVDIKALLLNCGIYDINRALSVKVLFNMTEGVCNHFTGSKVKDIKENPYFDVISPLPNINEKFPVSCVVYAQQDFFCGGQGEDLVAKLNELGVYNEVYFSTRFAANHTFQSTWKGKEAVEANNLFMDFAKRFFSGEIK